MKKLSLTLCAILSASLLTGCVASSQPNVYSRSQIQTAQITHYGTILSLKPIFIEGESSAILSIAGTALGALAGKQVGGGTGQIAGAVIGGLAGGYGVSEATKHMTKTQGVELTVKLDSGQVVTFAQEGNPSHFQKYQRVKIVMDNAGKARVDNSNY